MRCFKCHKELDREDGGFPIMGGEVKLRFEETAKTPENIKYLNEQLGKYSNGNGECHVAICYECYIDGLFQIGR